MFDRIDDELHAAEVLVVDRLDRVIALALLGHDMDQDRLVEPAVARVLQDRQQMVEIVPGDRPDIGEAQLVEQGAAGHEAAAELPRAPRCEPRRPGDAPGAGAARMSRGGAGAGRDDFVRMGLVADVPDQPVPGGVEDVMQRHRELDHAQAGAEMAAGDRNGRDRLLAQLVGQLAQLVGLQPTDVRWNVDCIEKWRLALPGHVTTHYTPAQGLMPVAQPRILLPASADRRRRLTARDAARPSAPGARPWAAAAPCRGSTPTQPCPPPCPFPRA